MTGERVPIIDSPHCRAVPSNPRGSLRLLPFPWVLAGVGGTCHIEKLLQFQVEASIDQLVDDSHVSSTTSIVETWDLQMLKMLMLFIPCMVIQ